MVWCHDLLTDLSTESAKCVEYTYTTHKVVGVSALTSKVGGQESVAG